MKSPLDNLLQKEKSNGRPREIDHDKVRELHAKGRNKKAIARELKVSRSGVQYILRRPNG